LAAQWAATLAAVVLLIAPGGFAQAQDRPLIEPLKIGYVQTDLVGAQLRLSPTLARSLWRTGHVVIWQPFTDGLNALRALDSGQVDLVLNATVSDVVAARYEDRKMVFVLALQSTASRCSTFSVCDRTQDYYTLSSEYLANSRDYVLLTLLREAVDTLQAPHAGTRASAVGPTAVLFNEATAIQKVSPVTREALVQAGRKASVDADMLASTSCWSP
jgi:hypothetical protein